MINIFAYAPDPSDYISHYPETSGVDTLGGVISLGIGFIFLCLFLIAAIKDTWKL